MRQGSLVVVVVLAATIGSLLTFALVVQPSDEPAEVEHGSVVLDYGDRLARIEALLEALQVPDLVPPAVRPMNGPERTPAGADPQALASLAELVAELRDQVHALENANASRAALVPATVPVVQNLDRNAPTNWSAVQEWSDRHGLDQESAENELKLYTLEEVVTRFGRPTRVEAASGGNWDIWWEYAHELPDGSRDPVVELYVKSGYVLYASAQHP